MIGANHKQVGCNTQGIYVMRHSDMEIMNESTTLTCVKSNGPRWQISLMVQATQVAQYP